MATDQRGLRTNEERIEEMYRRADRLQFEQRRRRALIAGGLSIAACLAVVIAVALWLPGNLGSYDAYQPSDMMNGSVFAGSNAIGFILIGLVAFVLGAAVTVFCVRLKKWQDEGRA